jgi:hypothetical protein
MMAKTQSQTDRCELLLSITYDPGETNVGKLIDQLQGILHSDYVTDRVSGAFIEVRCPTPAGSLNENGEVELSDGGCLELDTDNQTIRRRDKDGNTEDIKEPGDDGYNDWRDLFPKPAGFESADVSLFHLKPEQIQKLFDAATEILVAADGLHTNDADMVRRDLESYTLDEILALFPGDILGYRQRGIDFDPNDGEPWQE